MKIKKHTKPAVLISVIILLAVILAACTTGTSGGNQSPGENTGSYETAEPEGQETNEPEATGLEDPPFVPIDAVTAMESLAGVWWWPESGPNPIYVYADGTWLHNSGDIGIRGTVQFTQAGESYFVEFIVTEGRGPGAIGGYVWNRKASENWEPDDDWEPNYDWMPAHYWMTDYPQYVAWFSGTYNVVYDRLIFSVSHDDLVFEIEMTRDEPEYEFIEPDITEIFMSSIVGVWYWAWEGGVANPVHVNADGTWSQMVGDDLIQGIVELTRTEADHNNISNIAFHLKAAYGRGPGIEGSFNSATNGYYSVPLPDAHEFDIYGTFLLEEDSPMLIDGRILVLSNPDHPELVRMR